MHRRLTASVLSLGLILASAAVSALAQESGPYFMDPTARIVANSTTTNSNGIVYVQLGSLVYVGPFATLRGGSDRSHAIRIGAESNVQDGVVVDATNGSVDIAGRCILAHGSSVRGPARIGFGGTNIPADPDNDQEVFLSFGSLVDGGTMEKNTGISALGRLGPGVTLRSGRLILPGKNVTTQAEADDPALGKVRLIVEADVEFNEAVIEVNIGLARQYTRMFRDRASNVLGINYDPGGNVFDPRRDLPRLAGVTVRDPTFRNRIIGDVVMDDSRATLNTVMGSRISLRADEGGPFLLGQINRMGNSVIFHALEGSDLSVGDNLTYGDQVIIHGGGRVIREGDPLAPTIIEDNVVLMRQAIVFRSRIGNGSMIGRKSAVVGSDLPPGSNIPDRTIYLNDAVFGSVEW